jgi:arginase
MIAVPYHLGRRDVEVGRGPTKILTALGKPCDVVKRANSISDELDAVADVNTRLAAAVERHGSPAVILAGNCNSCVGTLAGLSKSDLAVTMGVIWFDAHGDFNTPETTISGALEGMSLAIATGGCHEGLRRGIGLGCPVSEESCVLVAARSLDPGEAARLEQSALKRIELAGLETALDTLRNRVSAIYLHMDLDVLDPELSPGVNFQAPGGITPEELFSAIEQIRLKIPIAAAAITNFNPDRDRDDRTLRIALRLVEILP